MQAKYLNHMGTDLSVVNAARVSFGKTSTELTKADVRLIKFLARGMNSDDYELLKARILSSPQMVPSELNALIFDIKHTSTHWTPFTHQTISVLETLPIFVVRQRYKHMVGFTYNEVSRRYVDDTPEFHWPQSFRSRPDDNIKQGSGGVHPRSEYWKNRHAVHCKLCSELYAEMIADNVAPEQARMELPNSMHTSYWVTGSLYAWANAYLQRSNPHAQLEMQDFAFQWKKIIEPLFPVSWAALTRPEEVT